MDQPRSFADVAADHAPALLRLAVMLTGNRADAEDLLQTTFLRTVRHADRVAAMAAPAAYLRRIMLNEQLSHRRRMRRRVVTVPPADATTDGPVASQADSVDRRDEVWRWLATLKPQQRAVLVLRFYQDLPDVEIADLLGCSEATVRSHAFRGLAALRGQLSASPTGDRS